MKNISILFLFSLIIFSCVPAKKYNELLEKERLCNEELNKFKTTAIESQDKANEFEAQLVQYMNDLSQLKEDTTRLGEKIKALHVQYDRLVLQNLELEKQLIKDKNNLVKQTGTLQNDLDAKNLELQRKEDSLNDLEKELKQKQALLVDRENKVKELEEALKRKDENVKALKEKVKKALRGYEDLGLTIIEKNGKLYVSLDAKLLFKSGSTTVEEQGKKAVIELATILMNEKDLDVVVEGHTDTDKLESAAHPKSNWELSVLRATAVVDIMLKNTKIKPEMLMAAGRGEFHPIDTKDKAKNRRIDIIISPNLNALFELMNK